MPARTVSFLLVLVLVCLSAGASAQALRIVSMNLCTDQLLLQLVERERIVSLSRFAADPDYSFLAAEARGIPLNRGQAEEVLSFAPDLVLTSLFSATLSANLLERLGHAVHRLGFANSLSDVRRQIREVAALTGSGANADTLLAEMDSRIDRALVVLHPLLEGKLAVFYSSNGVTYGADTLQHEFLETLGLRNLAAEAGLRGPAPLPLELLLAAQPDFIFTDTRRASDDQLAHAMLAHPALRALGDDTRQIEIPERWFQCAGPQVAEAWLALQEQLADAR